MHHNCLYILYKYTIYSLVIVRYGTIRTLCLPHWYKTNFIERNWKIVISGNPKYFLFKFFKSTPCYPWIKITSCPARGRTVPAFFGCYLPVRFKPYRVVREFGAMRSDPCVQLMYLKRQFEIIVRLLGLNSKLIWVSLWK